MKSHAQAYLAEANEIIAKLDTNQIERIIELLIDLRSRRGRLFILGVGGGASHSSHAVNDFRKIAHIEAYTPTDNVSELTARVNDDGWESTFVNWLEVSHLCDNDMIFIFSVGGGNLIHNISPNLVKALEYAKQLGAAICGVVGRDGGQTAQLADACVIIPVVNSETVTAHTEAFQSLILHLIISHPLLCQAPMKWESVQ